MTVSGTQARSVSFIAMWSTPGVLRTERRSSESKRQNTTEENSGKSTSLTRSDHWRDLRTRGRNVSKPFALSVSATLFSPRDLTTTAYHSIITLSMFARCVQRFK